MLYITTRNKTESYTSFRALHEGFAPDGGLFLPLRFPVFSTEEIKKMRDSSFCENIASVLNMFFSTGMTGWDVEFAIGRKPVGVTSIGRKAAVVELWKNTDSSYIACADRIYRLLCGDKMLSNPVRGWAYIAIKIAFLFSVMCMQELTDVDSVDMALSGADFENAIAAWYAKKMGLPIGKIIYGCNENCGVWDLLYKGQLDMSAAVIPTDTPSMDVVVPAGLERLIYGTLGLQETLRYLQAEKSKGNYRLDADNLSILNAGIFCSVVGKSRGRDIIKSVYGTYGYLVNPYTAISYGALQDYRAKTGENKMTLLLSEEKPSRYHSVISQATGLSATQINEF